MSVETAIPANQKKFVNRVITAPLGPVGRYHLKKILLLSSVTLICGIVLLLLLLVFSKLNLYYLESNGFPVDEELRDAYYSQVQTEAMGVGGFLLLQLMVTAIASIIVMRWASAPFQAAARTLETALTRPEDLRPANRWLSESPYFDRVIWLFALKIKNGGEIQIKGGSGMLANMSFLLKFWITFGILSVTTGNLMGIVIAQVYEKILSLAFALVNATNLPNSQHFFAAQQEILHDATTISTGVAMTAYFFIGLNISRYMTTMLYVFTRALEEDRFPVQLRLTDVYHGLAAIMNNARQKIR